MRAALCLVDNIIYACARVCVHCVGHFAPRLWEWCSDLREHSSSGSYACVHELEWMDFRRVLVMLVGGIFRTVGNANADDFQYCVIICWHYVDVRTLCREELRI